MSPVQPIDGLQQGDSRFRGLVIGEDGLEHAVYHSLPSNAGVDVRRVMSEKQAAEIVMTENPELILVDLELRRFKSFRFLSSLFKAGETHETVVVVKQPNVDNVVKCMQLGVRDVIQLPNEQQKLQEVIRRSYEQWQKRKSGRALAEQEEATFKLDNIIAGSAKMLEVVEIVRKVVQRRWVTVLICGETGTGKEVIARAIHHGTPGNEQAPFVEVNCTAIPENLLEAELFGHEKGAFTDAKFSKKGLFEIADGGTLFLDEIGDMPLLLQAKLLKAIEEKRFRRLGGVEDIKVTTRILAGTNADLEKRIAEGTFRNDLFYRLNVISILLPPLHERGEDILALAKFFMQKFSKEYSIPVREFSPEAIDLLFTYDWPGNVRELQHAIERVLLLGDREIIEVPELRAALGIKEEQQAQPSAVKEGGWHRVIHIPREGLSLADGEKQLIQEMLNLTKGNKTQAAQILGVSRPRLNRKIDEYNLAVK